MYIDAMTTSSAAAARSPIVHQTKLHKGAEAKRVEFPLTNDSLVLVRTTALPGTLVPIFRQPHHEGQIASIAMCDYYLSSS